MKLTWYCSARFDCLDQSILSVTQLFKSLNFMFSFSVEQCCGSQITQILYCPLHTLLRHVNDDESNSEKVIKNHRVVNKRQQDNINGLWLLLLAQLIHQKCGEEKSELIETNGMSKTNAMRKRKIGWKWIQQSFFFIYALCWRFMMWLLWVRDHKTLLGWLFGKQFNELLRLFTTINRLWSRQYSTMIVCSTLQHQNNKAAKRSVEKSRFFFPFFTVSPSIGSSLSCVVAVTVLCD